MKKMNPGRVDSSDGEIHFILEEFVHTELSEYFKDFGIAEIKRISRKKAPKPLLLFREELKVLTKSRGIILLAKVKVDLVKRN